MRGLQTILSLFSIKLKSFRSMIIRFYLLYYTKTSLKLCFFEEKMLRFCHMLLRASIHITKSGLSILIHAIISLSDEDCDLTQGFDSFHDFGPIQEKPLFTLFTI